MNGCAWCGLLLLLYGLPLRAQSEFWGELKAGRYGVGFRALYQHDAARSYDPEYPAPGVPPGKKPRPIFIAVWYPASSTQGKAMVQRDYYRVMTLDESAPDFAQRLRKFTRDEACEFMTGKEFEDLSPDERAHWDGLLATPVAAMLDAPPADAKFPVVIYHPGLGGTYEDNVVACEYLASHGYVVLSSAYQPADSSSLGIDGDPETSLADLGFLLRYAATLPFADAGKVAAMGHSYGAQAVLAWRAQPNSPLDAVIFLDSGMLYSGVDAPQFARVKAALDRNLKSATPVLFFADRERHPKFETFDAYLKFAPRYEVGTPAMEHNAYVSQGAVGKEGAVRRVYESVCAEMVNFLDAYVKGDAAALQSLRGAHIRYRAGAAPPPTGAQIARQYRADGSVMKNGDHEAYISAAALLFDSGEKTQAVTVLKSAARALPKSAAIQECLGEALQQTGDPAGATAAFARALALLPADDTLTPDEKARVEQAVRPAAPKERR